MPPPLPYPAISVVIPMYNAEKYIGACLSSILGQTFQNFEVIIVDDCSTDKSCEIVESFIPKFRSRLKLLHLKKNSGGAGIPLNKGINFSRGKYIYQVDNDDLIVSRTLEILCNYAEKFNADVVHMNGGFKFHRNPEKFFPDKEDVNFVVWNGEFAKKPTLESDDITERVKKICRNEIGWTAWQKFVKRDLLIDNEISFINIPTCQDLLWVIEVFCVAKKILSIPEPLYVLRSNANSITRRKRGLEDRLHYSLTATNVGLKSLEQFLSGQSFFQENPQYKLNLMKFFEGVSFKDTRGVFKENPPHTIYETVKPKFIELFGENGGLISYLVESSHFLRWNLIQTSQRIAQLENQLKQLQSK